MTDFETLTSGRRMEPARWEWMVPDGWQQGRGAFGGLVVAALARAVEEHVGDPERPLRSLTAELPGATLAGAAQLAVEPLRVGSGQSTVAARLVQEGEVRAHCVGVAARARAGAEGHLEASAPGLRPWSDVAVVPMGEFGPTFAKAFEYRTDGPFPFTSGPSARCEGWIRMREPGKSADAAWAAGMLDAWWPALFTRSSAPRPMGTVAFTMQVLCELRDVDPSAPCQYRAWAPVSHEGWVVELRELWGEDGRLIAMNQQTFAIIK